MAPSLAKRVPFRVSENSTNGEILSYPFNRALYKRQAFLSSSQPAITVTSRVVLFVTVTATTPIFLPAPSTTGTGDEFNRAPSSTPAPTAQATTGTSSSTETRSSSTTQVPIAPPPPAPNASAPSSSSASFVTMTGSLTNTQTSLPTGPARNPSSTFPPPRPPQSRMVEIGVVVAIVLGSFIFIVFALGLWIYGRRYQSSGRSWMHWRNGESKSRGIKYGSKDLRNGGRFLPPTRFPGVPASDRGRPSMLFIDSMPAFTFVPTEGSGPTSPSISPLEIPPSHDPTRGSRRKSSASSLGSGESGMSHMEMIRSLDPVIRRESHLGSLQDEWTGAKVGRELPSR